MTTTNNSIPTRSISAVNRKWTIIAGVALGIGAATVAGPAVQGGSARAHEVDPTAVYSELAPVADWARAHGLSGLSPASVRSATD
jgi:hypothetical protein